MPLLILIFSLLCTNAQATKLSVLNEAGKTIYSFNQETETPSTVGKITVDVLELNHIPYKGDASGIAEIGGVGSRVDVISDSETKAYGWCFSIDGEVPETMIDETPVSNSNSKIEWFYAYAHFKSGSWIGQCVRPTTSR